MDDDERTTDDTFADLYREHGMHPGWLRVWLDGVDVTDDDPSTWPDL